MDCPNTLEETTDSKRTEEIQFPQKLADKTEPSSIGVRVKTRVGRNFLCFKFGQESEEKLEQKKSTPILVLTPNIKIKLPQNQKQDILAQIRNSPIEI